MVKNRAVYKHVIMSMLNKLTHTTICHSCSNSLSVQKGSKRHIKSSPYDTLSYDAIYIFMKAANVFTVTVTKGGAKRARAPVPR